MGWNRCFPLYPNTCIYLSVRAMTFYMLMIDVNSLVAVGINMKGIIVINELYCDTNRLLILLRHYVPFSFFFYFFFQLEKKKEKKKKRNKKRRKKNYFILFYLFVYPFIYLFIYLFINTHRLSSDICFWFFTVFPMTFLGHHTCVTFNPIDTITVKFLFMNISLSRL